MALAPQQCMVIIIVMIEKNNVRAMFYQSYSALPVLHNIFYHFPL